MTHHLAFDAQHQTQDAVGAGVLRSHVQLHQGSFRGLADIGETLQVSGLGGAGDVCRDTRPGDLSFGALRGSWGANQSGAPRGTAESGAKDSRSLNLTASPNEM